MLPAEEGHSLILVVTSSLGLDRNWKAERRSLPRPSSWEELVSRAKVLVEEIEITRIISSKKFPNELLIFPHTMSLLRSVLMPAVTRHPLCLEREGFQAAAHPLQCNLMSSNSLLQEKAAISQKAMCTMENHRTFCRHQSQQLWPLLRLPTGRNIIFHKPAHFQQPLSIFVLSWSPWKILTPETNKQDMRLRKQNRF